MFCSVTLEVLWTNSLLSNSSFLFFFRVIKPEDGKKLADSWGAAFMESSAKENEVIIYTSSIAPYLCSPHIVLESLSDECMNILAMQTAVEVFKRIILEIEKADGNAPPAEKRCAVMWKCIQDITELISLRQEAQFHQLSSQTSSTPRHCNGPFLLHCNTRFILIVKRLPWQLKSILVIAATGRIFLAQYYFLLLVFFFFFYWNVIYD